MVHLDSFKTMNLTLNVTRGKWKVMGDGWAETYRLKTSQRKSLLGGAAMVLLHF